MSLRKTCLLMIALVCSSPLVVTAASSNWAYSSGKDTMSTGTIYHARIQSDNVVNFNFPYAGEQHAELILQSHPRFGKNVVLQIQKGQLMCSSYSCPILIRFDDAPPIKFSGAGPADHSTEIIFITGYDKFMARLLKAKVVRISVDVYHNGSPTFEFTAEKFDQTAYLPKK